MAPGDFSAEAFLKGVDMAIDVPADLKKDKLRAVTKYLDPTVSPTAMKSDFVQSISQYLFLQVGSDQTLIELKRFKVDMELKREQMRTEREQKEREMEREEREGEREIQFRLLLKRLEWKLQLSLCIPQYLYQPKL